MGSSTSDIDFLEPPSREGELGMLGHYRVIDQLGKGGMGFVFRAEDTRLQRTVALKVMNRKIAATPNSRARFTSEARAMAAVHHDNVATIFEVGEHNETPYMAMEMLKGSTLEKFKRDKIRPSYQKIIQFAKEMARGMAAAHAQGIVHRDIKPANMWIEEKNDRIKILDFGLALASTPVDQLAGRGSVIGTPGYLSPEQARSEPLDDRSDLYSVGVVLYELATGHLPLHNKSVAGQLIGILSKQPKPLRELNPEIPQPLADLIHKLLRKEPRHRVPSAAQLEKDLDRVAVECESKSEVAQALNKLQAGLDQIVGQKDEPDFSESLVMPNLPDPFAALPSGLPDGFPSGSMAATANSAAVSATATVASAAAHPYQKRKTPPAKKAESEPTALKKYWPLAAAAAVIVLIGVPLIVFMAPSGSREAHLIDGPPPKPTNSANNNSLASNSTKTNPAAAANNLPNNNPPQQNSDPNQNDGPDKGGNATAAQDVAAQQISDAMVPGAIALIDADKGNGSFENLDSGGQPIVSSGQDKKSFPGWTANFKGNSSGLSSQDARGASNGSHYGFANKKSTLDLSSDTLDYMVQPGDVFRVTFDIGSVPGGGKAIGRTKYSVILGFSDKQGENTSKWKLGEILDQTDIDQGKRTIGFQYTAQEPDIGNSPFLKISMVEGNGRRPISYLDNVQLTVQSLSNSLAAANVSDTTPEIATQETTPTDAQTPSGQMVDEPPPASNLADTPMIATSPDTPATDPSPSEPTPMRYVTLRTSDERGADATVKKGGSSRDTLGDNPSIAVQQRGEVQVQHSYLRFDLQSISPPKDGNKKEQVERKIGRVALILKCTGKKEPARGTITVYGASNEKAQTWTETGQGAIHWGNSFSEAGLDSLPLLAELKIRADQPVGSTVTITSPELADFIRNSPHSMTTLVLAGRSNNSMPLSFVSNDGSKEDAPALIVEVPE